MGQVHCATTLITISHLREHGSLFGLQPELDDIQAMSFGLTQYDVEDLIRYSKNCCKRQASVFVCAGYLFALD